VLRRFATTPAPPSWVLAAQVIVNLALALAAIVILVAGGVLFFGVHMPSQWGGFALSALLCIAAMFGIGLLRTFRWE
jgi:ABC-2 type transport system permease protein